MAAEPAYIVASDSETTGEEKSPPRPDIAIGIDIGTSQCSIAFWNGSEVELLKNLRNQKTMRTYVSFKDENPSAGLTTQLNNEDELFTGSAVFNMKRLIGRVDTDPVVHASKTLPFLVQTLDIGVRPFVAALVNNVWRSTTPEDVLAIFLVEVRAMVELRLKRTVRNVVLTIPVSFSRFQITRVERACAMAGLHVLRLMPEPTAVALLYAQQQLKIAQDSMGSGIEKLALIFNLGAGYCDVAVTATAGGVSEIKALSGGAIGGEDIIQNMMRHLLPDSESLFLNHGVNEITPMSLLRVATQDAIHSLSSQDMVHFDVDLGNGTRVNKVVTRKEFEEVNEKVFEKCEALVVQCIRDAKVELGNLSDVILVGGCSNIPKVRDIVLGLCRKDTCYTGMNPYEAVVCGAALEGAIASGVSDPCGNLDLLTIQVTPLSIGIRADGNEFIPIIHRNTTMPARRELVFTTTHDNQAEALIIIYEGEEDKLDKNHLLGYFKISIPQAPKGTPEINVCLDIDASNVLRCLAGVVLPGNPKPVAPIMEVMLPMVDDGHGWCAEALDRAYGTSLDLISLRKKA
ncbi:unnamed protein product [Rhodiola kirilowii]